MDWLRDNLVHIFEEQLSGLVKDPWKARDEYIEVVLDRSQENVENFLSRITEKDTNYRCNLCSPRQCARISNPRPARNRKQDNNFWHARRNWNTENFRSSHLQSRTEELFVLVHGTARKKTSKNQNLARNQMHSIYLTTSIHCHRREMVDARGTY